MAFQNIISQREALELVGDQNVTFIDGSWYLPSQNRNGQTEYNQRRIPGAVYFDIDKIADTDTDLPHMLPHPEVFAHVVGAIGVSSENPIVVYDGPGLFSAPRVWWTFRVMGAKNVKILEGGFDRWRENDLPVESGPPSPRKPEVFSTRFRSAEVASISTVEENVKTRNSVVIDARPSERFIGKAPEPREGLRSGHIPGSKSIPATLMVKDGTLADKNTLERHFRNAGIDAKTPVITTCGSGVTAAILALALEETGRENYQLFDGSWAQWGLPSGPEVEVNG